MADNVAITAGSGTTIAADEVVDGTLGTVKAQFVKLMDGTLDGTTKAAITAKATQGAGALQTQDFKDSGRVTIALTAEVAGAATTEGLLTLTESRNGAATGTASSKVITSGKRIRFQSVQIGVESLGSGTTPQRVYLRLRVNTAGATVVSSPQQTSWMVVNNAAIVKSGAFFDLSIPDGLEYNGDGTATYGFTIQFPDWVTSTGTVQAKVTILAFEY